MQQQEKQQSQHQQAHLLQKQFFCRFGSVRLGEPVEVHQCGGLYQSKSNSSNGSNLVLAREGLTITCSNCRFVQHPAKPISVDSLLPVTVRLLLPAMQCVPSASFLPHVCA